MAAITNKPYFGRQIQKGIEVVKNRLEIGIEETEAAIAGWLWGDRTKARTIKSWKTESSTPNSLDEDRLWGLIWVILEKGRPNLTWLLELLDTTSIRIRLLDLNKPDWLRNYLKDARACWDEDKSPRAPIEAEIERICRRYYPSDQSRIYLIYTNEVELDRTVARIVSQALEKKYEVFLAFDSAPEGEKDDIRSKLEIADFLIVLLSARSMLSEVVRYEVEIAYQLVKEHLETRPIILPVRLNYTKPFQYPFEKYLRGLNTFLWQNHENTSALIQAIEKVIPNSTGFPLQTPVKNYSETVEVIELNPSEIIPTSLILEPPSPEIALELPEGTMDYNSPFYIKRTGVDTIALDLIKTPGITLNFKGPRQVGKSSLLVRVCDEARRVGKRIVFMDFQLFDNAALSQAELFYRQFCSWISEELGVEDQTELYWKAKLGNNQCATRYVGLYLLNKIKEPIVLAMDEVDRVFDSEFRSDFFGMLRSWHNRRLPDTDWKRLDLMLVTSTEPYLFIPNLTQSPFNVGKLIDLHDFTHEEVLSLNPAHGSPFNPDQLRQLVNLLGGHPYLIRLAYYLIANKEYNSKELFNSATDEQGPFGDHLRFYKRRLRNNPDLAQAFKEILKKQTCTDELLVFRLRGGGLIKKEGNLLLPRCQLYADYFSEV